MKKEEIYSYRFETGLPFDKKIAENIDDLIKRVKGNKAGMIIVDGGVGEGKTTFLVHIADYINYKHKLGVIKLDLKDHPQIGLGGENFMTNLRTCHEQKLPACIYDEAGDFDRRGSLSRFNAMLNRVFDTFRGFKVVVLIGLPSFHILDNDLLLKNIPRLLLHCYNRKDTYGNFKAYSLYRMFYLKDKMKHLIVKSFAYDITDCNFKGQFLDLHPARSKQLDILSTKGKKELLKKQEVAIQGLINLSQIAKRLGRSISWARKTTIKLKLKGKKINGVLYYPEEYMNLYVDYLDKINEHNNTKR